jgi:hypothetical protein
LRNSVLFALRVDGRPDAHCPRRGTSVAAVCPLAGGERFREARTARRAGAPRVHKALLPATRAFIGAIADQHLGAPAPAVLNSILASDSGPSWSHYICATRSWFAHAAAKALVALPPEPLQFFGWLRAKGERDRGYAQTKSRCLAIDTQCQATG